MLTLIQKELNESVAVYEYYPSNSKSPGELFISLSTGEVGVNKLSEDDFNDYYLIHAYQGLRDMREKRKFLQEDTVAWY